MLPLIAWTPPTAMTSPRPRHCNPNQPPNNSTAFSLQKKSLCLFPSLSLSALSLDLWSQSIIHVDRFEEAERAIVFVFFLANCGYYLIKNGGAVVWFDGVPKETFDRWNIRRYIALCSSDMASGHDWIGYWMVMAAKVDGAHLLRVTF